jgi:hypothetical protein
MLVKTLEAALEADNGLRLPVWFHIDVLRRYDEAGARLGRTDNVGQVFWVGKFSVDFGLIEAEKLIHLTFEDLLYKVPRAERAHWLSHLVHPPVAAKFLKMKLRPGCQEDGDYRELKLD